MDSKSDTLVGNNTISEKEYIKIANSLECILMCNPTSSIARAIIELAWKYDNELSPETIKKDFCNLLIKKQ